MTRSEAQVHLIDQFFQKRDTVGQGAAVALQAQVQGTDDQRFGVSWPPLHDHDRQDVIQLSHRGTGTALLRECRRRRHTKPHDIAMINPQQPLDHGYPERHHAVRP
ncbi:hypothetical protein ACIOK4_43495 [Streptomyces bottropensis]|uniref:hypothetical protein n=1 Tax=Streptomyces bottropensis TaxID=42235 RepID=UPI0038206FB0